MIETWVAREAEESFDTEVSRRLGLHVGKEARRKLRMLNAATNAGDPGVPRDNRAEALEGDRNVEVKVEDIL